MKLNYNAFLTGLGIFLVLYVLHLLLLPLLLGTNEAGKAASGLYMVHQFLGLATCLVAGFFAARKAGRQGMAHGAAVAAAGTVVSAGGAVLWAVLTGGAFPPLGMLPFWVIVNGFLGGLAGLAAANLGRGDDGPVAGAER